jgi:hypothetical protein
MLMHADYAHLFVIMQQVGAIVNFYFSMCLKLGRSSGRVTKNATTRIRLTPAERAALEAAAARSHGGNVSAAMRLAIRAIYMEPGKLPDPPSPRNESKEAPKFAETGGASFGVQSLTNP